MASPPMFPYQYPQGGQSAQYAQYAQYTQMQQIQEARMQEAQMRHIQQHQGTSTHPSLALPPLAPNPSTQGYAGTTIHICANHNGRCLKCRMSHNDPLAVSQASDGSSIRHITINALYATRYRSKSLKTPSEFTNKLGIFDFIVQMSTLPKDKTTWLYNRVGVIGVMSHLRNHHTVVRKSSGPSMVMRRVDIPGPGYVVEFVLQSTPGHGDIGYYGWYRYHDGSIRVLSWNEEGCQLVAWKDRRDMHWQIRDNLVKEMNNPDRSLDYGDATRIVVLAGIIAYSDGGRSLVTS